MDAEAPAPPEARSDYGQAIAIIIDICLFIYLLIEGEFANYKNYVFVLTKLSAID